MIMDYKTKMMIIIFCFYLAFVPFINSQIDNTLKFNEIHRGQIKDIQAVYSSGLYGRKYKSADNVQFADGTWLFDVVIEIDEEVMSTMDTLYVCGTYEYLGKTLPTLDMDINLFGEKETPPLGKSICILPENKAKTYDSSINFTWVVAAAVIGSFVRTRPRRRRPRPVEEEEDNAIYY